MLFKIIVDFVANSPFTECSIAIMLLKQTRSVVIRVNIKKVSTYQNDYETPL